MVSRATTMSERHAKVGVGVGARKVSRLKTAGWIAANREEGRNLFCCGTDGGARTDLAGATEIRGEKAMLDPVRVKKRMADTKSFMVERRWWNCTSPGRVERSCLLS
jgi:hypothetical protein